MELSIIILNYNGGDYIGRCCNSLFIGLPNCELEIILVDNGSKDGSPQIIKNKYKDSIRLIELKGNSGPARGRNIGAKVAKGELLLFLDHDTFINKNTIMIMMDIFRERDVGIAGCKLLNEDGSHQPSAKRFPDLSREIFSAFLLNRIFKRSNLSYVIQSDKTFDVDWVSGACFMVRRDLFLKINGFDEAFFYGAEEADFCYRAKKAGARVVYLPEVDAVHVAYGSNLVVTSRVYSNPLKAKIIFFLKHYPQVNINFLKFILFIQVISEAIAWILIFIIKSSRRNRASIALRERLVRLKGLLTRRI